MRLGGGLGAGRGQTAYGDRLTKTDIPSEVAHLCRRPGYRPLLRRRSSMTDVLQVDLQNTFKPTAHSLYVAMQSAVWGEAALWVYASMDAKHGQTQKCS